jgi:hypothetical protein
MYDETHYKRLFDLGEDAPEPDPNPFKMLLILALCVLTIMALAGCSGKPRINPAPPAPVIAKIAIPVDCVISQVAVPAYPGDMVRIGDDVYTLARLAMADRRVRIAERDRLRAANANPCPAKE